MIHTPYLSVVAASRNDDHGGGLRERMQQFVTGLAQQSERFELPMELLLVEWNPPEDRAPLAEALAWPSSDYLDYRIVQVPPSLHSQMEHADRLPLFQMIAKNVGIRRARADFILATNIDLLFNDALMGILAQRELSEDRMYRVDRYDVRPNVPLAAPIEEKLRWCDENVVRVNHRSGSLNLVTGHLHGIDRFNLRTMKLFGAIRSLLGDAVLSRAKRLLPKDVLLKVPPRIERAILHTNACGDFTLLHKKWWHRVRGYAEWQIYSFHIDSLLCHAAFHAGAEEVVLADGARAFHIEHGGGWAPEAQDETALATRLDGLGLPYLSDTDLDRLVRQMYRERQPLVFNAEDWGMAEVDLAETRPTQAASA